MEHRRKRSSATRPALHRSRVALIAAASVGLCPLGLAGDWVAVDLESAPTRVGRSGQGGQFDNCVAAWEEAVLDFNTVSPSDSFGGSDWVAFLAEVDERVNGRVNTRIREGGTIASWDTSGVPDNVNVQIYFTDCNNSFLSDHADPVVEFVLTSAQPPPLPLSLEWWQFVKYHDGDVVFSSRFSELPSSGPLAFWLSPDQVNQTGRTHLIIRAAPGWSPADHPLPHPCDAGPDHRDLGSWGCAGVSLWYGQSCADDLDSDGDGTLDGCDNCPDTANPSQADCDADGVGDACAISMGLSTDLNEDGIPDDCQTIATGTGGDCQLTELNRFEGGADDSFGTGVGLSADTAVVSASGDESVSVYQFDGVNWSFESKFNGPPGSNFGQAVSVSQGGHMIIVGGASESQSTVGSAWALRDPTAGVWSQDWQFVPSGGGSPGDQFGWSVDSGGNWALIGAPQQPNGGTGKAYLFIRDGAGGSWSQADVITAPDGVPGDYFGRAVASNDDFHVIGAPGDDDNGSSSGSVYVYNNAVFPAALVTRLSAPDGQASDGFGNSVDISTDDVILIGAKGADQAKGKAYVYRRDGSVWDYEATLTASDGLPGDLFGGSVAIDDGRAIIGAARAGAYDGAAYLFTFDGSGWTQADPITNAGALFGDAVAISGDHAAISAIGFGFGSGAAYLYEVSCDIGPPAEGPYLANTFQLVGAASGTPWSWLVRFSDPAIPDLSRSFVPGVAPGGTALDVANAFAGSINAARDARGWTQDQFSADAREVFGSVYMSIVAGGGVTTELWVGAGGSEPDCEVSFLLPACGFNPTIEELPIQQTDCNANGWADVLDIASGTSADINSNGTPDECEPCPVDFNGDGLLDLADINFFVNGFVAQDPAVDFNNDGLFDLSDINFFVSAFLADCT